MTFSDDLARFTAKAEATTRRVFVGSVMEAHRSITVGSPITGAPGQPVDVGALRNSYAMSWDGPTVAEISSGMKYARVIEDGVRMGKPITLRSKVGGFHSVKATVAGFQKIVDHVTAKEANRK